MKIKTLCMTIFCCFLLCSAENNHFRVIDSFATNKNWTSEIISDQQYGPFFHAGVWSIPIAGPSYTVKNGKAFFHFPKLESWSLQGFEYAYHLTSPDHKGVQEFDGANYLSFNIINRSKEPVWLKFRLMDEIMYTYSNENGDVDEEALSEFITIPDSVIIKPNAPSQKIRIKLKRPAVTDPAYKNTVFKPQIKFFAFEVRRTISSSKSKPTIDCTLEMDHLQIEDETGVK